MMTYMPRPALALVAAAIMISLVLPLHVASAQETDVSVVSFEVDVTDPASEQIEVSVVVPFSLVEGLDKLVLTFWDAQDHPQAVSDLTVSSAGEMLAVEQDPTHTHQYYVMLESVSADVECRYTINPLFFPPGYDHAEVLNAAGRLTAEVGVLRLHGFVPTMTLTSDQVELRMHFLLPEGWTVVQPWSDTHEIVLPLDALSYSEYLAVGPFETETITSGDLALKLASLPGYDAFPAQAVRAMLEYTISLMDSPPSSQMLSFAILPETFLYGGSTGHQTIIMNADPHVIAHEMFHWWNNEQLVADDAKWFQEGFTDYYSYKIVFELGIFPIDKASDFLSQMQMWLTMLESDQPRSLVDVSLAHLQDDNASGLVYVKGNLFAWYLDTLLQAKGRNLDEVMRVIVNGEARSLTSADLQQIFHDVYDGAVDEAFDTYVNQGASLPNLMLLDDLPVD